MKERSQSWLEQSGRDFWRKPVGWTSKGGRSQRSHSRKEKQNRHRMGTEREQGDLNGRINFKEL